MSKQRLDRVLLQPRGLRAQDAARYVGVSETKFRDWVDRGIMPQPIEQDRVRVWDRHKLDDAFDEMGQANELSAVDDDWEGVAI